MYVDVYVLYIRSRMCTLSCTYHSGPCLRNLCTYVYVYKGEEEGEGGWVGLDTWRADEWGRRKESNP